MATLSTYARFFKNLTLPPDTHILSENFVYELNELSPFIIGSGQVITLLSSHRGLLRTLWKIWHGPFAKIFNDSQKFWSQICYSVLNTHLSHNVNNLIWLFQLVLWYLAVLRVPLKLLPSPSASNISNIFEHISFIVFQVKLLKSLGLQSTLITDGSSPINLFNTAHGLVGGALESASKRQKRRTSLTDDDDY